MSIFNGLKTNKMYGSYPQNKDILLTYLKIKTRSSNRRAGAMRRSGLFLVFGSICG
jgi:hypothetical protein